MPQSEAAANPWSLVSYVVVKLKHSQSYFHSRKRSENHWAHSEDAAQTGRMPRLIWVFAGRTCHFVGFVVRRLIYRSIVHPASSDENRLCLRGSGETRQFCCLYVPDWCHTNVFKSFGHHIGKYMYYIDSNINFCINSWRTACNMMSLELKEKSTLYRAKM